MDLEAAAAKLRRRQAELREQVRLARRRLASESPKDCTPWMRQVAARVLVLSDFSDEAVVKFLSWKRRAGTAADVRGWYGALSPAVAAKLIDPGEDPVASRQLAEAKKFVAEFQLVGWVKKQNSEKGIAPSASAVLEQAGSDLGQCRLRQNRYRWLKRCMTRWGARRVRLGGGDGLPADEFDREAWVPFPFGRFGMPGGGRVSLRVPAWLTGETLFDFVFGLFFGPRIRGRF